MMIALLIVMCATTIQSHKTVTTKTNPPFQMVTYDQGDIVCNFINTGHEWEPHYLREIDAIPVDRERYFLDIGAHVGWLSFYALNRGWKVVAFEPMRQNLEILNATLQLN